MDCTLLVTTVSASLCIEGIDHLHSRSTVAGSWNRQPVCSCHHQCSRPALPKLNFFQPLLAASPSKNHSSSPCQNQILEVASHWYTSQPCSLAPTTRDSSFNSHVDCTPNGGDNVGAAPSDG